MPGRADHSSRGVLPSVVCLPKRDRETSITRRSWPARGCCAMEKKKVSYGKDSCGNGARFPAET